MTTPEGDEIVPLPADHVEGALLLRITRRQTSMREDQTLFITPESVQRITALIEKCKSQCGLSRAVSLGAKPKCLLR